MLAAALADDLNVAVRGLVVRVVLVVVVGLVAVVVVVGRVVVVGGVGRGGVVSLLAVKECLIVGLDLGQLVVESGYLFEIKRWKFDRLLLLLLRWLGVVRNSFEVVGVLHTLLVPFFVLLTEIDEGGGFVVSVDSGTHLQVQEHRGHLAGRTDEHLNFASLNRVVARLTASLLEGEEVLSPPGGEVVGILHLIELVLLVPSLALDIIRVRGHVDWLIPLFNMSSRSVSNLHLARKSAGELSIAVLVFVGEPLVEDLAVLEH